MRELTRAAIWLIAALLLAAAGGEGADRIGKSAPGWREAEWVQGGPLELEGLKGRVVLVRWWTGPQCPYCAEAAPRLNEWHAEYAGRGLVVVGLYHHKSPEPLTRGLVAGLAERLGFLFPIAIDPEWRILRRWWLAGRERAFTSVTFLLDRDGIVRYVHPGGSYSGKDVEEIEALIESLVGRSGGAGGAAELGE